MGSNYCTSSVEMVLIVFKIASLYVLALLFNSIVNMPVFNVRTLYTFSKLKKNIFK